MSDSAWSRRSYLAKPGYWLGSVASNLHGARAQKDCRDAALRLNGKGAITSVMPQGETVEVTLAGGGEYRVLSVDRCTGALLQTLTITP